MNANIGKLNSGKCYVYINGYKAEPFWGTEAECEAAILAHGVAEPIPVFCDGVDLTTSTKPAVVAPAPAVTPEAAPVATKARPTLKRQIRTYTLTIKPEFKTYSGTCVIDDHSFDVYAYDRNDAMRQGRESWRENVGPYGPKAKITARLAE